MNSGIKFYEKKNVLMWLVWMMIIVCGCFWVEKRELLARQKVKDPVVERVGGDYLVKKINILKEGVRFEILFEAAVKSGRFDYLRLVSDHVHFGIKEGSVVRLSADVIAGGRSNDVVDVEQMVLFLKSKFEERMPVWMSASSRKGNFFGGAKYLDMHAPMSDYTIF